MSVGSQPPPTTPNKWIDGVPKRANWRNIRKLRILPRISFTFSLEPHNKYQLCIYTELIGLCDGREQRFVFMELKVYAKLWKKSQCSQG